MSMHFMTELSEMSDSKKMSNTSIYEKMQEVEFGLFFFLNHSQGLGICIKVQYFQAVHNDL